MVMKMFILSSMKKTMIVIFIIYLVLILITGCTENNQNGTSKKTYTWTAEQVVADIPIDTDWNDGIQLR
jgi:predicted small secreted protein